ncbi:Elongation of fatty acids protein 2 [Globomyces sp. JEL0801]|nr:Elongation of fatty acids protein 2 [Globomyces sp. JEL0801]
MVENGIKPCYLAKRGAKRAEATKAMEEAVEAGDQENIEKFSRRTVKVTKEHNEDCQRLLELMGIPWMKAPCEAEAQCAALAAAGKVYGVGSEDLDTLTFGAPVLLRHLTFSEARKMPIVEMHYEKILEGLELNNGNYFIDLCILLGCDYCDSIRGVGPHRAVQLIKEHRNIETILKNIDKKKYTIPDDWPFEEARRLFKTPDVTPADSVELKWKQPDEEGIIQYLVTEKGFNDDRVRKSVQKLMKLKSGTTQGRLDGFFTVLPKDPATAKQDDKKDTSSKKKGKTMGRPRR